MGFSSGGAYIFSNGAGQTAYAVHLGVFSTQPNTTGEAAYPKPGLKTHVTLKKDGPASEALVRVVEGLVAQRHHWLAAMADGAPMDILRKAGYALSD